MVFYRVHKHYGKTKSGSDNWNSYHDFKTKKEAEKFIIKEVKKSKSRFRIDPNKGRFKGRYEYGRRIGDW